MSELYRPAFLGESKPLLAFGFPFEDACLKYVEQYGAAKIYILASPSLSRTTTAVERLHRCLDGKVVKTRMGVGAHTPFSDVLDIIHDVRKMEADFLVTLGGGSLTDAAKIVAMVSIRTQRSEPKPRLTKLNSGSS
jgi:alcohol dehydrogenase class IV